MAQDPRYFPLSHSIHSLHLQQKPIDPHQELLSSLARILTTRPLSPPPALGWTLSGLYKGPTSTAYLFLQLSSLYPNLELQGKTLHEWCLAYLSASSAAQTE